MRDFIEDLASAQRRDPVTLAREKMKQELPRRFYDAVTVAAAPGGFAVLLDDKPVHTPARNRLIVPTEPQAAALAAEWSAQESHIDPARMPVTRFANAVIDGVARDIGTVKDAIAVYAANDLVLYRADGPQSLVERQAAAWDGVVCHGEKRLGVIFQLAIGVMPVRQADDVVARLRALLPDDPFRLGALEIVTTVTGSALLALYVLDGRATPAEAHELACIDEDWNLEKWGADEEAANRRRWHAGEIAAAAVFLP